MMGCNFSLEHYFETLKIAKSQGYLLQTVSESRLLTKHARIILRHDVDFIPEYALKMAKAEHENDIHSTYYILLRDDYYNPLSKRNIKIIQEINDMGHEIGLHYDSRFATTNSKLEHELTILSDLIGRRIESIAAHTPNEIKRLTGKNYLEDEINLEKLNVIESKSVDAKYISDSGRQWREGCMCQHIGKHKNEHDGLRDLQILTHPFWWADNSQSIKSELEKFKKIQKDKFDGYITDYQNMVQRLMDRINKPKDSYEIW